MNETPCPNCSTPVKIKSPQQKVAFKKYGRLYCSKHCKTQARQKRKAPYVSVKKVRTYVCAWCFKEFKTDSGQTFAHYKKGHRLFCSKGCRQKNDIRLNRERKPHQSGPCETCGKMFNSRIKGRKFCSMDCYTKSPRFGDQLKLANEERAREWLCFNCGSEAPRKRKFCDNFCRREFYAARYDRFIASPQEVVLPQGYDEFLMQDELPCLVQGCEWVGKNLGRHVDFAHGIPQEIFKALAGFNRSTALVGKETKMRASEHMKRLLDEGIITDEDRYDLNLIDRSKIPRETRLEGLEHMRKAQQLRNNK